MAKDTHLKIKTKSKREKSILYAAEVNAGKNLKTDTALSDKQEGFRLGFIKGAKTTGRRYKKLYRSRRKRKY